MTKRNFTLIKGGMPLPDESDKMTFISAYVTDTRLMGVVGLYIRWQLKQDVIPGDFHQFFYFDAEEYGFETYRSLSGSDVSEIDSIEHALMGGLGGERVDLTKKEAIYLIKSYAEMNRRNSLPLPDGTKEYDFLLNAQVEMTPEEERDLFAKQCTPVTALYQSVNYFLMRIFGKDHTAAAYLSRGEFSLDIYADIPTATLCKNTIDYFESDHGGSYLCESLIEHDAAYMLIISEVTVKDMKITSFENRSRMQVSTAEAAMMLSRPEYVTVYEILCSPEEFDTALSELTPGTLLTLHENGRLYLLFNKKNDHVNSKVFRLNEDVSGIYYISDYGQMIIAAYSMKGIHSMEKELRKKSMSNVLMPVSKYEFKEPVLYEFIQSEFEDFEEFLDFIKD